MNIKNTVILLILLLSIVGLIIGVHYTTDESSGDANPDNQISIDGDDQSIIIYLEKPKTEPSLIDRLIN